MSKHCVVRPTMEAILLTFKTSQLVMNLKLNGLMIRHSTSMDARALDSVGHGASRHRLEGCLFGALALRFPYAGLRRPAFEAASTSHRSIFLPALVSAHGARRPVINNTNKNVLVGATPCNIYTLDTDIDVDLSLTSCGVDLYSSSTHVLKKSCFENYLYGFLRKLSASCKGARCKIHVWSTSRVRSTSLVEQGKLEKVRGV